MAEQYQEQFLKVEISFPQKVDISNKEMQAIQKIVGQICNRWELTHPGRVMWPSGIGFKITYMPMTREEEETRGMEFAEDTFEISCTEREDYDWVCNKCGHKQGDHAACYFGGIKCNFEPKVNQ